MSIWLIVILTINTLFLSVIALGAASMAYMDAQEYRRAKNNKPNRIYCCRCDEEIKEELSEYNKDVEVAQSFSVKCQRIFQCP